MRAAGNASKRENYCHIPHPDSGLFLGFAGGVILCSIIETLAGLLSLSLQDSGAVIPIFFPQERQAMRLLLFPKLCRILLSALERDLWCSREHFLHQQFDNLFE